MNPIASSILHSILYKWIPIRDGQKIDLGPIDCILCQKYCKSTCTSCPVYKKTGQSFCEDTPFIEWSRHMHNSHPHALDHKVYCEECRAIAQKEVMFLYDLFLIESQRSYKNEVPVEIS